MSRVPARLPEFFPARFHIIDVETTPGHTFCLHLEHGHLLQKQDGALHEGYIASARHNGLAGLFPYAHHFGIFQVLVGAHCQRDEARDLVRSWAMYVADTLGQIVALGLHRAPAKEPA